MAKAKDEVEEIAKEAKPEVKPFELVSVMDSPRYHKGKRLNKGEGIALTYEEILPFLKKDKNGKAIKPYTITHGYEHVWKVVHKG